MPENISNFQTGRQVAFETQTTLLDHMMHIVGRTIDKYGKNGITSKFLGRLFQLTKGLSFYEGRLF